MNFNYSKGSMGARSESAHHPSLRMSRRGTREARRHLRSRGFRRLVRQIAGKVLDQRARELEDQPIVFPDQRLLLSRIVQADLVLASPRPTGGTLVDRDHVTGRGL